MVKIIIPVLTADFPSYLSRVLTLYRGFIPVKSFEDRFRNLDFSISNDLKSSCRWSSVVIETPRSISKWVRHPWKDVLNTMIPVFTIDFLLQSSRILMPYRVFLPAKSFENRFCRLD